MTLSTVLLPGVPPVESPFFASIVESLDREERRIAVELHQNGFAILEFPDPELDSVAERIKKALSPRFDFEGWRRTGWANNAGLRVQDAWDTNADVRRLAVNASVQALLSKLYGRRAFPFQTLNFPVGTQQHYHSDAVHFSTVPERFMCGVWVALEDIGEEAGPLIYYPGSHRLPIFTNEHLGVTSFANIDPYDNYGRFEEVWEALVDAAGLRPATFCARKGQALIWAANLLHGGDRHRDPTQTRWSQVTHYFFEGCAYYTPLLSDPFGGSIQFRDVLDISMTERVPNRYVDRSIPQEFVQVTRPRGAERQRLLPPDFDPELYLEANPDVRAAGVDPVAHYLKFGRREGRKLRP
jgi:hypothetical protein